MSQAAEDLKFLRACIAHQDGREDDAVEPNWYQPFCSMLSDLESGRWSQLTERQRGWVRGVYEKLFDDPVYENLWSGGKVPRGGYGKSPMPEVLSRRPLKPPGGRA